MPNELFWVIEMQGPSYLTARRSGGYEFCWTDDIYAAIRFHSRDMADLVMMTIRQLRGDLFPPCLPRVPCATEHMMTPSEGIKPFPLHESVGLLESRGGFHD